MAGSLWPQIKYKTGILYGFFYLDSLNSLILELEREKRREKREENEHKNVDREEDGRR